MEDVRVVIVGAGIGGLTAALALQKAGLKVDLYEQATELREVGAGLTITPNASHVLNHLGLGPLMARIGTAPALGAIKDYASGATLVALPHTDMVARYGAQRYLVHRADLYDALLGAVLEQDQDCVHTGHCFKSLRETASGVNLSFENGAEAEADLLVGADGVKSVVRTELFGQSSPKFTGYIAWRGLVPMDRLDKNMIEPESALSIGSGHMFTRYLIRGGSVLNYVAFAERNTWTDEGWAVQSTVAELVDEFAEAEPHVRAMLAATPPELCFKWGLFDRQPLDTWTIGRATLLGDAPHPMTPFLGQGAVMAIEDGMVLARAIEAADDIAEAFATYERARVERANFVMLESLRRARILLASNANEQLELLANTEEAMGLFGYNPVTVPLDATAHDSH
jgi:salicylate hydroxylase